MAVNIEQIRNRLKKAASQKPANQGGNEMYRHWDAPNDSRVEVRFLEDKNTENPFFWREKQMIKLTFPGVIGHPDYNNGNEFTLQVPCVEMYEDGRKCPVMKEVSQWFDSEYDALARKYWKKRSYLLQGFVVQDPTDEKNPPENPIRTFTVSSQIFKQVKDGLLDPEMENNPVDHMHGTNFVIKKTKNGQYADYNTSGWARSEKALTQEQLDAIEQYGLIDLGERLPKCPDDEHVNIIYEMFQASVNGDEYDPVKWGKYYKPYGLDLGTQSGEKEEPAKRTTTPPAATKPAPAEPKEEELTPTPAAAAEPATTTGNSNVNDILARIRNQGK